MNVTIQGIKQRFGIIGMSPALDHALSTAIRVAPTDLSVLIAGESGVGKEVFSKIIHSLSPRKHSTFIAINCGAIPEGTINSELFGHEKGAFTGATSDRKGYFETVNGGTIFLDEISEMPLDTQAFLLRILESGEFLRVGSSKVLKTDVRVIAATNLDLFQRVKSGKFREDLYYRLSTVPIQVPALRHRRNDIYMLFRKFVVDFAEKYKTPPVELSADARLLLEQYHWPGNIRELKNVAEQVSVLTEERHITAENLEFFIPNIRSRHLPAIHNQQQGSQENLQEREILYKLLFDMKSDLNDLKSLVFELIQSNDLRVPDKKMQQLALIKDTVEEHQSTYEKDAESFENHAVSQELTIPSHVPPDLSKPIILQQGQPAFHQIEEVDENLSLEEMEKDLIKKALIRHKGRRKDAASDLGISERTLYRKIKQYELQ